MGFHYFPLLPFHACAAWLKSQRQKFPNGVTLLSSCLSSLPLFSFGLCLLTFFLRDSSEIPIFISELLSVSELCTLD